MGWGWQTSEDIDDIDANEDGTDVIKLFQPNNFRTLGNVYSCLVDLSNFKCLVDIILSLMKLVIFSNRRERERERLVAETNEAREKQTNRILCE